MSKQRSAEIFLNAVENSATNFMKRVFLNPPLAFNIARTTESGILPGTNAKKLKYFSKRLSEKKNRKNTENWISQVLGDKDESFYQMKARTLNCC